MVSLMAYISDGIVAVDASSLDAVSAEQLLTTLGSARASVAGH